MLSRPQNRMVGSRSPSGWITTALVFLLALQGCGSLPRRDAVPYEYTEIATPPGSADARFRAVTPEVLAALARE